MTRLIGLAGSVRQGSLNAALLRAAAGLMPDSAELAVATIRGFTPFAGAVGKNPPA